MFGTRLLSLSANDYLRLLLAAVVVFFEGFFRIVFFFVPNSLVMWLNNRAAQFFPRLNWFKPYEQEDHSKCCDMCTTELVAYYNYRAEEHVVQTADGYLLTLHRVLPAADDGARRPPVFLQHGLMQNSEVWVCTEDALPYKLVDSGYDVWLGNTRGNKYSCRNVNLKPFQKKFWDFSIDEMALYDVPASVDYVLEHTGFESLSYVGFSQGSATFFACASLNHKLSAKVNMFVALSPAAKAQGLRRGMLQTFIRVAPTSLFLIFGTGPLMSWVEYWRRMWTTTFLARMIYGGIRSLFDWTGAELGSTRRREQLFAHLFSFASVKTIVHWFQIVTCDRFQAYDENQDYSGGYRHIHPLSYPIHQIRCPMAVIYGSIDYLTDIPWLLSVLPPGAQKFSIENYEHLDTMWAVSAPEKVFPKVIDLIDRGVADFGNQTKSLLGR